MYDIVIVSLRVPEYMYIFTVRAECNALRSRRLSAVANRLVASSTPRSVLVWSPPTLRGAIQHGSAFRMVADGTSDVPDLGGWIIYSAEHSSLSFEGELSRARLQRARVTGGDHEASRPHIRSNCCSGCIITFNRLVEEVQAIQSCAQRVALDRVSLAPVAPPL